MRQQVQSLKPTLFLCTWTFLQRPPVVPTMEFSRQKRSPSSSSAESTIQSLAVSPPCYVTEIFTYFWSTTVAIDEALLQAVGELSFDYTSKFVNTDIATFEVIKLKSDSPPQGGLPKLSDTESGKAPKPDYDVQINITSLNRAVDPPVSVTVVVSAFLRCVLACCLLTRYLNHDV